VLFCSLAILHSLISILTIETDAVIDLRTFDALVLVVFPLMWIIYSLVVVSFFLWKLALNDSELEAKEWNNPGNEQSFKLIS
jgi:hypothetical protein